MDTKGDTFSQICQCINCMNLCLFCLDVDQTAESHSVSQQKLLPYKLMNSVHGLLLKLASIRLVSCNDASQEPPWLPFWPLLILCFP